MRRSPRWIATAFGVVALLALLAVLAAPGGARSSVLSRDAEGWAAVRSYLLAHRTEVVLLDRPLADAAPGRGTLVLAFPWQHGAWDPGVAAAVRRHRAAGGHLLVAYSGGAGSLAEEQVLADLELPVAAARPKPPLAPSAWRRHVREVWRLEAEGPLAGTARDIELPALDRAPTPPLEAEALYRSPGGHPIAFAAERGTSRVVVVPAAALANARLALPGNADLLESLRRNLPAPWSFDELHHGLAAPGAASETLAQSRVLDLVVFQVVVLYLLFVAVLARRFGPAWREAPIVTGSTAAFFLGLGALHHRLGHHADAARRLLVRSRELERDPDRDSGLPADLEQRIAAGVGADGFLEAARSLARRRTPRRTAP